MAERKHGKSEEEYQQENRTNKDGNSRYSRRNFIKTLGTGALAAGIGMTAGSQAADHALKEITRSITDDRYTANSRNQITGIATGDSSYETIKVGAGQKKLIRVRSGETFQNKLIDITADDADARIVTSGDGWTVRNIGIKGAAPAGTHGGFPNRLQANGTGLVEHIYVGDGVTPSNSRGGCLGVSRSSSGEVTFRECHWGHASDNGVYASGTAVGGGGTQHFERCLARNNNISHFRIASDGSTVKDCVAHNTNDVPLVSTCNCVNSRGAYDGYGDQSQTVIFENVHIDQTSSNTNGNASALVAGKVNYVVKDSQIQGDIIGNVETENVGGNPSHNAPSGVPLSAEEAAAGTSSAKGLPHEVTADGSKQDEGTTSSGSDGVLTGNSCITAIEGGGSGGMIAGGGPPDKSNWKIAFEDGFDGSSLDEDKWDIGFGWGMNTTASSEKIKPENVYVENGKLHLKGTHEGQQAYAGAVNTKNIFTFGPGSFFEARLKNPMRIGFLPAFWSKPNSEKWPPEIDVMELFLDGGKVEDNSPHSNDITSANYNVHYSTSTRPGDKSSHATKPTYHKDVPDLTEGYHTYGCKWLENKLEWYFDGEKVGEMTDQTAMKALNRGAPFYMMLNIHIDKIGQADYSEEWGEELLVDWVRVWEKT